MANFISAFNDQLAMGLGAFAAFQIFFEFSILRYKNNSLCMSENVWFKMSTEPCKKNIENGLYISIASMRVTIAWMYLRLFSFFLCA